MTCIEDKGPRDPDERILYLSGGSDKDVGGQGT